MSDTGFEVRPKAVALEAHGYSGSVESGKRVVEWAAEVGKTLVVSERSDAQGWLAIRALIGGYPGYELFRIAPGDAVVYDGRFTVLPPEEFAARYEAVG